MAVARLGFKRRATAVLKSNLIPSIEFRTAVAQPFETGLSKISSNFTLHLIKVGKLKRFKKVSSDLKTILKTDLRKAKHVNQS